MIQVDILRKSCCKETDTIIKRKWTIPLYGSFHFLNRNPPTPFLFIFQRSWHSCVCCNPAWRARLMIVAHTYRRAATITEPDIQRMSVVVCVCGFVLLLSLMGVLVLSDRCSTNISSTDRTERGNPSAPATRSCVTNSPAFSSYSSSASCRGNRKREGGIDPNGWGI